MFTRQFCVALRRIQEIVYSRVDMNRLIIEFSQSTGLHPPLQVGISAPPAHLRTPYQVTSFGHLIRGSPLLAQRAELRPKEDPVRFAMIKYLVFAFLSCPSPVASAHIFHVVVVRSPH